MKNFVEKKKNKKFRYWLKKRMWTPYEMDKKDPCQSDLEDEECSYGYIVDVADLGYDWLIGISEDSADLDYVQYYKLSELDLAISERDQD